MDQNSMIEAIRKMLWDILYKESWMDSEDKYCWYVEHLREYGIKCCDIINQNGVSYMCFRPDGTRAAEGYEYSSRVRYQEHDFTVFVKDMKCEPDEIMVEIVR